MRILPFCLGLAGLWINSACFYPGDWAGSDAFREDFHSTHALQPGGKVSIESFNGAIEIASWDQNSVEVNGTKHAGYRSALDDIKIDIDSTPESIRIRAVRPDGVHNAGVRFSLRVPRAAVLDFVSTSNGRIDVDDMEGNAHLRTTNGGIRVARLKGNVEAQTTNGAIEAQDLHGNANLRTTNGPVRADATGGSFEAVTSNGRIEVRLNDPQSSGPVHLRSSNGHIELTLDGTELPDVHASTSNSSILLRMPASANARLRAHTSSHSPISSDFAELHDGREPRRAHSEVEGSIGRGGPLLDLETSNGPIRIQKL